MKNASPNVSLGNAINRALEPVTLIPPAGMGVTAAGKARVARLAQLSDLERAGRWKSF